MIDDLYVIGLFACAIWAFNLHFKLRDIRSDMKASDSRIRRYRSAVDEVDKWCGNESPEARLIARFIGKTGEGFGANAGTPVADEFCTISGTREQIRRIKEKK